MERFRQPTLITSVQRALRLLEEVGRYRYGATAKQLARATGLALGTTYHLLRTLAHEGYLVRDEGRYHYGEAAAGIGRADRRQRARRQLGERMAAIADELDAAVYLAVYEDGEVRVPEVVSGPGRPAVAEWADFRATAHAHAIGLCLLSQLGDAERRDHLDRHPPEAVTPFTVAEPAAVLRRLEAVAAVNRVSERQEYALGSVCAAVPLAVGGTVAAVALSLPLRHAGRLAAAAERLRVQIGAMAPVLAL
ncbi:IclR family transcriptional regulator [Kitasatospora sp. NPDC059571]|uniref:IclR family transcriptional regulator n=1 Tax=Kitasatospora sp. NPDC059571 TaxID=3346871 RepID=UPI0036D09317